jgi:hypothetical protein
VTHLGDRAAWALGMLGAYPDLGIPVRGGQVIGEARVKAA